MAYPRLLRRIRGAAIDGVVLPVAVLGSLVALSSLGVEQAPVKIAVAVVIVLLLEPMAVAVTGGSIGHHLAGIGVRRVSDQRRLGIFAATLRFLVKTAFGLPSFLLLFVTRRRQSLHDLAARSEVVFKAPERVPAYETLGELTAEGEARAHASVWRRIGVIAVYWIITVLAVSLALDLSVSMKCMAKNVCTEGEQWLLTGASPVVLATWILLAILGWRGHLPGCRKPRPAS